MTDYVVAEGAFVLQSLWTRRAPWRTASVFFHTQSAPIKPGSLVLTLADVEGNALTASVGLNGEFAGDHVNGRLNHESGAGELQFGDFVTDAELTPAQKSEWWYNPADMGAVQPGKIWRPWPVDPSTLRINAVSFSSLPLDAEILGLDPVRLPPDGRVPWVRPGSYGVLGHTASVPAANLSNGLVISAGRMRLSRMYPVGADGKTIYTGYTTDLDAGKLTVVNTTGWAQPVRIRHRIEQMSRVMDVQINGTLTLSKAASHDFPAGSVFSTAIVFDDLYARVPIGFDQQTWDGVTWQDTPVGNVAPASYNDAAFPMEVSNEGVLPERWAFRFTSTQQFECIGEHVGNIGSGNINTDFSPINPITGKPYFVLRAGGWGTGWAVGNILRRNTTGSMRAYAAIRTVQPSDADAVDFDFEITNRGGVDRPATM